MMDANTATWAYTPRCAICIHQGQTIGSMSFCLSLECWMEKHRHRVCELFRSEDEVGN